MTEPWRQNYQRLDFGFAGAPRGAGGRVAVLTGWFWCFSRVTLQRRARQAQDVAASPGGVRKVFIALAGPER
jgi:hypothetical protein